MYVRTFFLFTDVYPPASLGGEATGEVDRTCPGAEICPYKLPVSLPVLVLH